MARRSGGTHKGVEEKRRSLPIYQHYTLSPGKTKSHHPEAKCNHCLKEFVCGSKQRLIRHLRKCNSIANPEQIIAETLNTLARNSATGTLNHSILEASNLLPSQMPLHMHHHQIVGQPQQQHPQQLPQHSTPNTANQNTSNNQNNNNNINNIISNHNNNNNNTSVSSNDIGLVAATSGNGGGGGSGVGGPQQPTTSSPIKRPVRRGRKPGSLNSKSGPSIQVTTGLDGKTHFTPISQLPSSMANTVSSAPIIAQVHNGNGGRVGYTYHAATPVSAAPSITAPVTHLSTNSGHLACATPNHHPTQAYNRPNAELIDKAYLKLVVTRNLPLSLCDTKEFQVWVKTFVNDYKPPSSINLVTQNLKLEAQVAKQRISNILVKASKKTINLELHSWPDQVRGHLWYAVIANIDLKRFLISVKDIDGYVHNQSISSSSNSNNNISSSNNISNNNNNINNLGSSNNDEQVQRLNETNSNNNNNNTTTTILAADQVLAEFIDNCIKRVGSDRINSLLFSGSSDDDLLAARARESLYTTYPSIVTYYCWWNFTNLLCADIVERNEAFQHLLRNSNRLINFVNQRPKLAKCLEKFNPFAQVVGNVHMKKNDKRWYSHLVCYLLEYIKNNNEAITRIFASRQSHSIPSDNNNNSNNNSTTTATTNDTSDINNIDNPSQQGDIHQPNINESTQLEQASLLYQDDSEYIDLRMVISSSDYWSNLKLALVYLKPIHDIVALTSTIASSQQTTTTNSTNNNNNNTQAAESSTIPKQTQPACPNVANSFLLSDYMHWFLGYGQTLFNSWRQAPDSYKYNLIAHFLNRFNSSFADFKLLFAAYLLNPKHRCAFMTQEAKNVAIEEILNIASEFMPEESDGHTIFDQWKLYLVREEPYDMVYEESRSTPLEWWMSIPCAESIRRVALRILRLKAFTSPKPESLFKQLYFYEDETKSGIDEASFNDLAVLRYFYDFEDKVGQVAASHGSSSSANNALHSNGFHDRTQIGQLHNHNDSPETSLEVISDTTNRNQNFSYSDAVAVESYLNNRQMTVLDQHSGAIEDLSGYKLFVHYVDYNDTGVHIVEEPIEKKRRKWTAQEILSKCQSNNNNDINNK